MNWLLFLRENGFGACLADDMGLGKTIQMIAYFLHVKESGRQKAPALIIAPTSVLGNWQRELQTFAPQLKAVLHYAPAGRRGKHLSRPIRTRTSFLLLTGSRTPIRKSFLP